MMNWMRKVSLVTDQIYHIFNRGVNKGEIFFQERDYQRFLLATKHYLKKTSKFSHEKLLTNISDPGSEILRVEILAYCLMPNHFHFLIKQKIDGGVTSFMQQQINSYVHYVNIKHKRLGPLFQGRFVSVLVDTDEQLTHVSRYIHLNPVVSGLVRDLNCYRWSSYLPYIRGFDDEICSQSFILGKFKSKEDYKRFVLDQASYGQSLEQIKHHLVYF